ncbi:MAG: hypothetical protein EOO14_20070, partial [Chitinophagaceae bacterium]
MKRTNRSEQVSYYACLSHIRNTMRNLLKNKLALSFTIATLVINLSCSTSRPKGPEPEVSLIKVGEGWANNSVNVVPFRKNALVTYKD